MTVVIFEFKDYKAFLSKRLELDDMPKGVRSRLAEAVQCHTAYVSQVLNGEAHFSLEQADRINQFLGHAKGEARYFLLLVQYARAGSESLKEVFLEQLDSQIQAQFNLKDLLNFKRILQKEDQATFYSSWHYGAVHVLVSVPGCSTERGISRYLALPLNRVSEILHFLESVGLVEKKDGHYRVGASHIHLDKDSAMISKHHANWRLQAIQSLDQVQNADLHYSSVITASKEDSTKIKEILVRAIEQIRGIVKGSKNEEGFCYSLDFFGLKK